MPEMLSIKALFIATYELLKTKRGRSRDISSVSSSSSSSSSSSDLENKGLSPNSTKSFKKVNSEKIIFYSN